MQQQHPTPAELASRGDPPVDGTLLDDLLTMLRHPGLWGIQKGRYGASIPPLIVAGTDCFLIGATLEKEWQCEWSEGGTLAKAAAKAAAAVRAVAAEPPGESVPPAVRADVALVLTHPRFYRLQRNTRRTGKPDAEAQIWYCVGLVKGQRIEWWDADTPLEAVEAAARTLRARASFPQLACRLLDLLPDWRSSR